MRNTYAMGWLHCGVINHIIFNTLPPITMTLLKWVTVVLTICKVNEGILWQSVTDTHTENLQSVRKMGILVTVCYVLIFLNTKVRWWKNVKIKKFLKMSKFVKICTSRSPHPHICPHPTIGNVSLPYPPPQCHKRESPTIPHISPQPHTFRDLKFSPKFQKRSPFAIILP